MLEEIIKNMLKEGYGIQEIIKITGYSRSEIKAINDSFETYFYVIGE
ncbi:hypothetical protein Nther_2543 [Natranaerobius thermophilus JW/NM-WN-LF]|uniref:Uncharacterized protein n=1 Tax=Natranaerobius thermophilus (strain ATCC BAA-1301 / DSM 18059 / JW/NM-WN-LF) TaxID=457570 RepID=B2A1Q5_NATTJ|nr:hypothetical protein Nther_2543 [Natranaerobius thermophilus JW/NM-WN-LF]